MRTWSAIWMVLLGMMADTIDYHVSEHVLASSEASGKRYVSNVNPN
jgi:hypothetical protein